MGSEGIPSDSAKSNNGLRKGMVLAAMLFFLILGGRTGAGACTGIIDRMFPAAEVFAAGKAAAAETIHFTNNSGKYLEYIDGKFHLYNRKGVPLTGPQYLKIPAVHGIFTGFYFFDENGVLLQEEGVRFIRSAKTKGVEFHGYYYTTKIGRFFSGEYGLYYLSGFQCRGLYFSGYFYVGACGKLCDIVGTGQVRYLQTQRVHGTSFSANYYYFNKCGKLCTRADFHDFTGKVNGFSFKGSYYFGDSNGGLSQKAGWVTVGGKSYYISSQGQKYVNRWVDGYYVLGDGTIARSMQVPDGSYVDCDGRKCAREEMALSPLKKQLTQMIAGYPGTWSVYVKDLKTGTVVSINDSPMYPASTIKAFVMASTFDQISQKKLSYSSTIKSLLNSMITVSSNEAYNQLVRYNSPTRNFVSGAAVVNQYLTKNGYTSTACHTTLQPAFSSYASDGGTNRTSARDCGLLLERIYRGTCVSSAYSSEMLNLLLHQTRRIKIPAGLPSGTKVANKTGETNSYQHDIAIVYGPKTTYVLCVFSRCSAYSGVRGIQSIAGKVHSYLN